MKNPPIKVVIEAVLDKKNYKFGFNWQTSQIGSEDYIKHFSALTEAMKQLIAMSPKERAKHST